MRMRILHDLDHTLGGGPHRGCEHVVIVVGSAKLKLHARSTYSSEFGGVATENVVHHVHKPPTTGGER